MNGNNSGPGSLGIFHLDEVGLNMATKEKLLILTGAVIDVIKILSKPEPMQEPTVSNETKELLQSWMLY